MVPMIDLLMVTIAFLLVTAVWSHMYRLEGSAKVPGTASETGNPPVHSKALHVDMRAPEKFVLSWREGPTVSSSVDVERDPAALARAIGREWRTSGVHTSPGDLTRDEAVLHTANDTPFAQMVAVMDAIEATERPLRLMRRTRSTEPTQVPAFALTLATQ
jgi:biopolymer transport protein ExbD